MPKSPPNPAQTNSPLDSAQAYEEFIYGLPTTFSSIEFSTLVLVRTSLDTARVEGKLHFAHDAELRVRQFLDFDDKEIVQYSYEFYQGETKLWWYDPWPHPQEKSLKSSYPHHKHIEPDIKHHRVPAPDLSFERPNLPFLIREIETFLSPS